MICFLVVCLALAGSPMQDPPIPAVEPGFEDTPLGYKMEVTDYRAVCEFFGSLQHHIIERSQQPEYHLGLTAARIGLSTDSEAWRCILEANPRINEIADRVIPAERQQALAQQPVEYKRVMSAFHRQQVLDMRREFLEFRAEFERAGGDMGTLMAYIRDWADEHLSVFSDKPNDHPDVREFLAVEALFDDALAKKGGSQ